MRKDGTRVDISLTISPIRTGDGKIIGASKIARDITEQKRAERERRLLLQAAEEARQEAETANKAKDNFLALLSHELRTPLHSMRGWLTMLSKGLLDEAQKERAVEVLMRGIESQKTLVEDLLDVSRIVSGKLYIEHDPVSMISVVSDAVEQLRPSAGEKSIDIETKFELSSDEIIGDATRLQQIVGNLLNNAIKYSHEGGKILVRLTEKDSRAMLTIQDQGVGIDQDHLDRIFDRFEQGDSSSRRSFGGLGLGLTIAKYLTELHGGAISAASEGVERGATFTISLPLSRAASDRYGDGSRDGISRVRDEQVLQSTKILVVEDDTDSLEMLRLLLETAGAEVTPVDHGQKAVDELSRNDFDLMISDLGLPEMDGYDLIKTVRHDLGLRPENLPAIALSGYVAEDDRHRSLSSGFQLHLQKPLDISSLTPTILSLLVKRWS
jgi:signal transduction histidine kinase/CheY-like chemotaxis protein